MTFFTDGLMEPAQTPSLLDAPRSYGEMVDTVAGESLFGATRGLMEHPGNAPTKWDEQLPKFDQQPAAEAGGLLGDQQKKITDFESNVFPQPAPMPMLSDEEAQAKIKASGLEGRISLPSEQKQFYPSQIDMMINHGKQRAETELALARGPQGIAATALSGVTSLLVGAIDPVNLAAGFIPVIGEARYAKLLASAGESALARAGVRASVGAASGAVGGAVLTPLDWLEHSRDGQDYGMSEALHSMIFYSALGGALHSGGGALADVWRGRTGRAVYPFAEGEAFEPKAPPSVYNDVLGQLKASGVGDDEASHNAGIFAARYATRAERLGLEPQAAFDLYKNENLDIRAGNDNAPESDRAYAQQAQNAPAFYSTVDRAVSDFKQENASGEQWLGTIKNIPGVKPEELEWLGLDDFLKDKKSVSKTEVQDYIRANQVEVKEVEKGEDSNSFDEVVRRAESRPDALVQQLIRAGLSEKEAETRLQGILDRDHHLTVTTADLLRRKGGEGQTKFASYQLPGGENYRELLLTLPSKPHLSTFDEYLAAYRKRFPDNGVEDWEVKRYYESGALIPGEGKLTAKTDSGIFKSSHFDEPNVLAHVRFNDRVIDGKKTLFIEEVQSDWHQKGKREGYADTAAEDAARKKVAELKDAGLAAIKRQDYLGFDTSGEALGNILRHDDWAERWDVRDPADIKAIQDLVAARKEIDAAKGGVPDAPFKNNWSELAMKRMIRYAAEHGYEKVAWTTGEQQAARYDLSKQISKIRTYGEGAEMKISAWDKSDNAVMDLQPTSPEKLSDMIGKDAADKLMAKKPDKNAGMREISGLELKVGGEGMKGFYDQILPATVNKLVKKYGGKVQEGSIGTAEETLLRRKLRENGYDPDTVDAQKVLEDTGGRRPVWLTDNEVDDLSLGLHQDAVEPKNKKVHTLDLTPELKQAALEKGFPLFQKSEAGDIRGRISFGENRKVIELFKQRDASTFMHEAGHLWLDELARDAGLEKAPTQIKDDMATVRTWLGAKEGEELTVAQHEQWAQGFERYLADGSAPSKVLQSTFERFKDWLKTIYHNLTRLGAPVSDEIRGVMDRMLASDRDIGEVMADLPPRAQEDSLRMAIANIIKGEPVKVSEMLDAAAKADPRIADSVGAPQGVPVGRAAAVSRFWDERLKTLPDYNQPAAIEASRAAEDAPELPDMPKKVQAAQKALADAESNMALMLEEMPEDLRTQFEDSLKSLDEHIANTQQVIGNAAACMTASGYA